tara:strand:- start:122 stop:385 length:264 start_codon:yes stop_codon:yes gene_type:complete
MMILEISVVILFLLFLSSCYIIWNLNTKQEILETWIEDFIQTIEKVNIELKQIDYLGSFESDDETGTIFEQIKTIIKQLDKFKGEQE